MKFKVGDRVATYRGTIRRTGVVEAHQNLDWVYVRFDKPCDHDTAIASAFLPQAVRRLKPKRKAREFVVLVHRKCIIAVNWGAYGADGVRAVSPDWFDPKAGNALLVREVLPKKGGARE